MESTIVKSSHSNEVVLAMQSSMIRNCAQNILNNTVVKAVAKAAQFCGQIVSKEDAAFISSNLCDVIRRNFPNLRVEEIPVALERGVLGEYGEFYGINVASLTRFIKSYIDSESRMTAAKALINIPNEQPSAPHPEKLWKTENDVIINAFRTYCETGKYTDYGNHIYNKLDERGLIKFTSDEKYGFMAKARTAIELRNNPTTARNTFERRKMALFLDSLSKGLKSAESAVIREAKKIALLEFFSQLKNSETEIKKLLEDKQ